ncbi:hypothetical protein [Streptomyces murinus]|uniref:hypothetical protein n=1 Tax=Streptomyces murinus TaxID=33900 RepID=UPI002E1113FF|nr:hypothetical protein OG516_23695 [Streptomyces murinus]
MGERDGDRRGTGRAATPDVESHLGTALRAYDPDPEAERRALAAFRTAHASGRTPRTRPRDDWRPAPTRGGAALACRKDRSRQSDQPPVADGY